MKMKVVLVQPGFSKKQNESLGGVHPPIGLAYLAAFLEKVGIEVEIIDANILGLSPSQAAREVIKKSPSLVGVTFITTAHDWGTKFIKKIPKNILKIAGGPHATSLPKIMIKEGFDIVVLGEGEETLSEIAKGKPLEKILGIVFKKGKKVIASDYRPPLNPNKIPPPARHLLFKGGTNIPYFSSGNRLFPWASIMTSRGCPYNCYYCHKSTFGQRFLARSPENVINEIDFLVRNYKIKELDFYDDCFNFDEKRAETILDIIIKHKYNLWLRFASGLRADKINSRFLKKMKKAGCRFIAYGIESGNQDILNTIPKGETLEQISKAIALTKKEGIEVAGFFILGFLDDTTETMRKTIEFAKGLDLDNVQFAIATPYPGTRMWNMIMEKKGKFLLKNWSDYSHSSGKMTYYIPGGPRKDEVEKMYRLAYREFYFRPSYMLKQITKITKPGFLTMTSRGVKRLVATTMKK